MSETSGSRRREAHDPGAYIGNRPERSTDALERQARPGRPGPRPDDRRRGRGGFPSGSPVSGAGSPTETPAGQEGGTPAEGAPGRVAAESSPASQATPPSRPVAEPSLTSTEPSLPPEEPLAGSSQT